MGKKRKEKTKLSYEDTHKTMEERQFEVKNLLQQLSDLGIYASTQGMHEFLKLSQDFIKNGTYWKGRIHLTGTHRILCGFLTNRSGVVSDITLKYVKDEN